MTTMHAPPQVFSRPGTDQRGQQPRRSAFWLLANRLAPAERRGQVISAFFVACYAGLIIPVVGVGVLSEFTGTFSATATFSVLLAALCLFSISRFTRDSDRLGGAR